MPAYSLVMWNSKSANNTQALHHSYTRDTSTTLLEQRHVEGRNSKPLLTSFQTSIQHSNLHLLSLKQNYRFLDINLHISDDKIQTSVYYKETDTHNYLHFSSFHPDHCKRAIPYSQFLRLHRLCSDDDDFLVRSREMLAFFSQRDYPCSSLENDLRRVATINRPDALRSSEQYDGTVDRVPLVLTYHPFNTQIKRFLLQNFQILATDQQT